MSSSTMEVLQVETLEIQGRAVPSLGLGTWQLEGEECQQAVIDALEIGYRRIDTAQAYGNEAHVGRALEKAKAPLDEIFITTKIWWENLSPEAVRRSTEESLGRLRLDAVDLLLIHWPNPDVPLEETLGAMEELRQAGKARALGVSNFPPEMLHEALEIAPILSNQIEYHPFLAQEDLLALCRAHDVMLTAYSPLARGEVPGDPVIDEIAKAHGKTPAQVTLRWLLQQEKVSAIPKASSPEHRRENLDVFDFELTPEEMLRIHRLERGERLIDPEFAPDWES